jgi:hypothetical protein
MVLLERIELSTSPLPRECSTTELQQRTVAEAALYLAPGHIPRNPGHARTRHEHAWIGTVGWHATDTWFALRSVKGGSSRLTCSVA